MARQRALEAAVPFLKWAGGKRQLLPELRARVPRSFGAYHEPFLGGGALAFEMITARPGARCSLSDLNSDLVIAYVAVRDRLEDLLDSLRGHAAAYAQDPKAYYYATRASAPRSAVGKASRLLFLNRTCFNGLYRVNSSGRFNVPMGGYENPNIVNEESLRAASRALGSRGVTIECADFGSVLRRAERGDFVYLDPPYQPVSRTAAFTGYTSACFGGDDLRRLADACDELASRGCHVLVSNSDTGEVRSAFGGEWDADEVGARRRINSDGAGRSGHVELLIRNYV